MTKRKEGFTLVELSIVLVIIGLLIGGILTAQSMIENARMKAQIKQLEQFDIASRLYIVRYRALPGDIDANDILECDEHVHHTDGICPYIANYSYDWDAEIFRLFHDLSTKAGLAGNYQAPPGGHVWVGDTVLQPMFGPGRFLPYAAFGRGGIYGVQNANKNLFWVTGTPKHVRNGEYNPDGMGANTTEGFKPSEALAIDSKIDDSNARTGTVTATHIGGSGMQPQLNASPEFALRFDDSYYCADAAGAYKAGTITKGDCALQFKSAVSLNER